VLEKKKRRKKGASLHGIKVERRRVKATALRREKNDLTIKERGQNRRREKRKSLNSLFLLS